MIFIEMLSYPFLARALLVGVLVSLCAALLGTPLVLKRYSMIGDGLSHVGFGSLAVATALGLAPLAVTVPVVALSAVLLLRISQNGRIRGDAAIALISSGALALGVIVVSLTSGMNMNVSNYMFGSILTVSRADAALSVALCAAVIALFTVLYDRIFAVTFDETFAAATGTRAQLYNTLLAVLTAVTVGHGGQLRAGDPLRRERGGRGYPRFLYICAGRQAAEAVGRLCISTGIRALKRRISIFAAVMQ